MAETTWNLLNKGLQAALQSCGLDLGTLHFEEHWAPEWTDFLDHMTCEVDGVRQVRGWEIVRRSVDSEWFHFGKAFKRTYNFQVTGCLGLYEHGETEQGAQDLVDRLMDFFDGQPNLPGTTYFVMGPCRVERAYQAMVGDVLCHVAELNLPIQVIKEIT